MFDLKNKILDKIRGITLHIMFNELSKYSNKINYIIKIRITFCIGRFFFDYNTDQMV